MKNPGILILILIPCFYIIYQFIQTSKASEQFYTYSYFPDKDKKLVSFRYIRYLIILLNGAGVIFLIIALSHISSSMKCDDNTLSRLEKSKESAKKLIYSYQEKSRFSVTVFAGKAVPVLPLTADKNLVISIIDNLSPDMLTADGSAISAGILKGSTVFPTHEISEKKIILYTDGEESIPGKLDHSKDLILENFITEKIKIVIIMPDMREGVLMGEAEDSHLSVPDYEKMEELSFLWGGDLVNISDFNKSFLDIMKRRIRAEKDYSKYYLLFSIITLFASLFIRREKL